MVRSRPRTRRMAFGCLASLLATALALAIVEAAAQLNALMKPAYHRVSYEADPVRGWRHRPGLRYRWAGSHWFAREFSVEVQLNAHGDRDAPRELARSPDVFRVALLGDSFVEAEQVELERTAASELERLLVATPGTLPPDRSRAEVLNFGVSAYGVGQCFLTYLEHARRFDPDRVAIFVAGFHMVRTVTLEQPGVFPSTVDQRLSIRPRFEVRDGALTWHPSIDVEQLRRLQARVIQEQLGGEHFVVRDRKSFLAELLRGLPAALTSDAPRGIPTDTRVPDAATLALNLRILAELGERVRRDGGELLIADASTYIAPEAAYVSEALRRLCQDQGLVYVDLGSRLEATERAGAPTRFPIDGHWNEVGNRAFAEALLDALRRPPRPR